MSPVSGDWEESKRDGGNFWGCAAFAFISSGPFKSSVSILSAFESPPAIRKFPLGQKPTLGLLAGFFRSGRSPQSGTFLRVLAPFTHYGEMQGWAVAWGVRMLVCG
jgi:hypothetical protein